MKRRYTVFASELWMLLILAAGFISLPAAAPVKAQQPICSGVDQSVSRPLIDLGHDVYIRMDGQTTSFTGGLYPDGKNTPPAQHAAAGLAAAANIQPRDKNGNPDPEQGRVVLISVGMSNTDAEFIDFQELADQDREINNQLVLINGALGGQTAEFWTDPVGRTWQELGRRLEQADLSPLQVQAAWVKQTHRKGGDFPGKALELQKDLETIARNLKVNFPNLQIAYFSSRTRSFNYYRGLSPEPYAFETGFSVKWMIEKQIAQDPALNYDAQRGEVVAPLLLWGPYLWIDGENPRSDGRAWLAEDLAEDCTHPSPSGTGKVAEMLLEFFKQDPSSQPWFLGGGGSKPSPTPQVQRTQAAAQRTAFPTTAPSQTPEVSTPVPQIASSGPATQPAASPTPDPSSTQTASQESLIWVAVPALLLVMGLFGIWIWKRRQMQR